MTREEAINEIKSWAIPSKKGREVLETLIPELVDSKDEEIRKDIIEYLKLVGKGDSDYAQPMIDRWIAYLEKQKEQKPTKKFDVDAAFNTREPRDNWEYIKEFCDKFGRIPKDMDELDVLVSYVIDKKQKEHKPVISDEAIREGVAHFGITQYQIDNWLKKHINVVEQKPAQYDLDVLEKHITKDSISELAHTVMIRNGWDIVEQEQKPEEKPINWTELTWEDINELEDIINKVHYEFRNGIGQIHFGKEVLERFREYKGDEYLDGIEEKPVEWSEDIIRKAVKEVGLTQHQIDWFKTNVFPPKQEERSEDEKIRNWLISVFDSRNERFVEELDNYRRNVTREQILAYLEKMKEVTPCGVDEFTLTLRNCLSTDSELTKGQADIFATVYGKELLNVATGKVKSGLTKEDIADFKTEKQKERKDYNKLYEDIAKSEWFKKAYEGKSLGGDNEQGVEDCECDKETITQKAYREGQNAGRQEVFDNPGAYGLEKIDNVFGFRIGDKVRLVDGDGRPHIIKYFEKIEGLHGPDFYRAIFEDNTASDHIIPGDEYPNGYFTCMEKIDEQKEQKPVKKQ